MQVSECFKSGAGDWKHKNDCLLQSFISILVRNCIVSTGKVEVRLSCLLVRSRLLLPNCFFKVNKYYKKSKFLVLILILLAYSAGWLCELMLYTSCSSFHVCVWPVGRAQHCKLRPDSYRVEKHKLLWPRNYLDPGSCGQKTNEDF